MYDETQPPYGPETQESEPSLLQRVVGVFFSPATAFRPRLSGKAWILPLVILAAAIAVEGHVLRPLALERMEQRFAESDMPEEARERALEGLEQQQDAGPESLVYGFLGGAAWTFLAGFLLTGLLCWVGANFVFGGQAPFWGVVSVVGLSHLVFVVRSLLTVPLKLSKQSLEVFTSLALLPVGEPGSKVQNALNAFDIFEFWFAVVAGIGLSMVAGIARGKALAITLVLWGVWAFLKAAFAFLLTGTTWGALLGF